MSEKPINFFGTPGRVWYEIALLRYALRPIAGGIKAILKPRPDELGLDDTGDFCRRQPVVASVPPLAVMLVTKASNIAPIPSAVLGM